MSIPGRSVDRRISILQKSFYIFKGSNFSFYYLQIRGAKYADIWGKCPAKRAHQPGVMIHFYISCEILAWGRFIVLFMDHAVALAPSVNLLGESHLAISLMDADGSKEWEIDAARNPAKNKLNCPIKIYKMNWLGWPTSDRKVVNFPSHENRVGRGKKVWNLFSDLSINM